MKNKLLFIILTTILSSSATVFAKEGKIHPAIKLINEAKKEVPAISPKELKQLIDNEDEVIVLDVREILERSEGQIYAEDTYAMTRGDLEFFILTKIKDTSALVVTYCRGGTKGVLAAQTLKKLGYKNAKYLNGGLRAWANAGYPIETGIGITILSIDQD